jgi:hypothetical protein
MIGRPNPPGRGKAAGFRHADRATSGPNEDASATGAGQQRSTIVEA